MKTNIVIVDKKDRSRIITFFYSHLRLLSVLALLFRGS